METSAKPASFRRITKRAARKLWAEGETFVVCPCRLYPSFPFGDHVYMNSARGDSFDSAMADWQHWNASWEAGYYAHFYLEE